MALQLTGTRMKPWLRSQEIHLSWGGKETVKSVWRLSWVDQERKNSPDTWDGVGKGRNCLIGAWNTQNGQEQSAEIENQV